MYIMVGLPFALFIIFETPLYLIKWRRREEEEEDKRERDVKIPQRPKPVSHLYSIAFTWNLIPYF